MSNAKDLLSKLREENIKLVLHGDNLEVVSLENRLSPDLIQEIKACKADLIHYLKSNTGNGSDIADIPVCETSESYPLSSAQRRLWVLSQFKESSTAYNMPDHIELNGEYNIENFKRAIDATIERHEILRTVFKKDERGDVRQLVVSKKALGFALDDQDLRTVSDNKKQVEAYIKEDAYKPFNLAEGPLFRTSLLRIANDRYVFYFNMHHIISDGWSMDVLAKDVFIYYEAYQKGEEPDLEPLRIQYKDYAVWQIAQLNNEKFNVHKDYWVNHLSGALPLLDFPTRKLRPKIKTHSGRHMATYLSSDTTKHLRNYCQTHGLSMFIVIIASLKALFYRYTSQNDLIIGSPIAGRDHKDLKDQIGFYINMLALRNKVTGTDTFEDLVNTVKETTLAAYTHQSYPFDRLVEDLELKRDISRNPLFDISLTFHNISEIHKDSGINSDIVDAIKDMGSESCKFDMEFHFQETGNHLSFEILHNTDVYENAILKGFMKHYKQLLAQLLACPDQKIGLLNYLSEEEKHKLLYTFNDTKVNYPADKTIVNLFEEQVKITPDKIAVKYNHKEITYNILNELSNQLAGYLRNHYNINPDDLAGIKLERSEWTIIAMLGILKSGGAYVPVDVSYPEDRIRYMIEDSKCKVVIDDEELAKFREDQGNYNKENLPAVSTPDNLAYVIYTSGTTGKPKGTLITHKNVVRLMKPGESLFDFSGKDVWTMFHSYCFDFSVWEMYGALLYGGKLVIVPSSTAKDPKLYLKLLKDEGVTVLNQTPTAFYNIAGEETAKTEKELQIRYVIFGGEALSPAKLKEWNVKYPDTALINMYGITETTVHVTYKKITGEDIKKNISNVGRPIPTLSCYVLDQYQKLLPIGVPGELYVGGEGVARGYLNRETLTKQRFIKNPYKEGERLYRSGDKVRLLENGEMEYMGRIDDQVKIRGYRIELGEIVHVLQSHDLVEESVVLARENEKGQKNLIAYILTKEELNSTDLRTWLKTLLPDYMVPSHFVTIEKMPLTANGKVDKKSLPDPEGLEMTIATPYIAPGNETEKKLAAIWEAVLEREKIGVKDDFFELGGDSIKAIRLVSAINEHFGAEYLSIASLYSQPDISGLLQHINNNKEEPLISAIRNTISVEFHKIYDTVKKQGEAKGILTSSWEDVYPMSSIQVGMVYHSAMERGVYHDQMYYQFNDDAFSLEIFSEAVEYMVKKHEILRTSFYLSEFDTPVQILHSSKALHKDIFFKDLIHLTEEEKKETLIKAQKEDLARPFTITDSGLWRIKIFQLSSTEIGLLFVCHHAIIDGWSEASFITELSQVYYTFKRKASRDLIPLHCNYKDYVIDQFRITANKDISAFWKNEVNNIIKNNLPLHPVYKGTKTNPYGEQEYPTGKKRYEQLQTYRKAIPPKHIFLAAYLYLIYYTTNEVGITVGLVSNTRPELPDGDKILGCFLNMLPFHIDFNDIETEGALVNYVDAKMKELKAVDKFPMMEMVKMKGSHSHENPFYDTMFNYVDFHIRDETDSNVKVSDALVSGYAKTEVPLSLNVNAFENDYILSWEYQTHIYNDDEIERLNTYLLRIIDCISEAQDTFGDQIMSLTERHKLLENLNDTEMDYPKDKTLTALFEAQATERPDDVALVFKDKTFTYKQLNEESNQLACYLQNSYHIKPDDLIGIKLDRSEWMIIAILGILKSGGAYLPIDPDYPQERINYIIQDSQCKALIDENELEKFKQGQEEFSKENQPLTATPHHLAYVIYTSGTTGQPKGSMLEHSGVVNRIEWMYKTYRFTKEDVILQKTTYTFDVSVWELFMPLCWGVKMALCQKEDIYAPDRIIALIASQQVTCLHFVPSMLKAFMQSGFDDPDLKTALSSLKRVITSGEALPVETVKQWYSALDIVIHNLYGPTEASVDVTCYETSKEDTIIPIGKPIDNTQIYIVNDSDVLVPEGVAGEICIGGAGLARGYLNKPELTAEKFVSNPFRAGEKMYKTGDLGKWLPDGNIAFIGRIDHQIKIRGFRIELGEIEHQLLKHNQIKDSVVIVRGNDDNKQLAAYYVSANEIPKKTLKDHMSESLPYYMVPSYFMHLESMPITSNGKINRKALPDPEIKPHKDYESPSNETEEKLAKVWAKVLQIEKEDMPVNKSFFEIGGHSLTAIHLVSAIKKEFNFELPLVEIFNAVTIKTLSGKIQLKQKNKLPDNQTITLMKRAENKAENLFFIHDGSGDIHGYVELVKAIHGHNCRGLRSDLLNSREPQNITMAQIASKYIENIKKVQLKGPYKIIGWSLGGNIAFEVVRQLELVGEHVDVLIMIDTLFPFAQAADQASQHSFSAENEKLFIKSFWDVDDEAFKDETTISGVWQKAVSLLKDKASDIEMIRRKVSQEMQLLIPQFNSMDIEALAAHVNTIRALQHTVAQYRPQSRLKTRLIYVKAKETDFNPELLSGYFEKEVRIIELEGNHFTILRQPVVKTLAKEINLRLNVIKK